MIKRLTLSFAPLLAVTLLISGVLAGTAQASVALRGAVAERYSYTLAWEPRKRFLHGTGSVWISNAGPEPVDRVWLRLRSSDNDMVKRINWVASARIAEVSPDASTVELSLLKPLDPGRTRYISFGLQMHTTRENTSFGRSAGIDLFGDALPVIAVDGPRGIRAGPEPAYGEGSMNPVAQWSVSVKVPRGLEVMAPGDLDIESRSKAAVTFRGELDARDFAFAIGRFKTVTRSVGDVEVSVVGSRAQRDQLKPALNRAVHAFRTLQRWYGGYDYFSLRLVLGDLPFGGSEYPGIVFSTPDNATIAHEVAHQWFYGLVGNDQYNDPFLDESLTAFAEQRFHHSYRCNLASPIDGRSHGLGTGMSYWQHHPDEYEQTIYRGGACALTVLQRDIGKAVFDRALRAYVTANANQIAGVDDFLAAIRNAAPGYDLARWERLVGLS
jgi:hypothetical protein